MVRHKKAYEIQLYDQKEDEPKHYTFNACKGLFMALLSGLVYCLAAVIVKQIENIHPGQLAVYRFTAFFSFSLPMAVKCKENLLGPRNLRLFVFLASFSGSTAVYLSFVAYRYLPLGESAVIIFSVPIFVSIAARIFLKEPCGVFQSFAVLTTVAGIMLTTKFSKTLTGRTVEYRNEYTYGVLCAVGTVFCKTCWSILNLKIKSVHHSVITFNMGWVGISETVILTFIVGNFRLHICGLQTFYIILMCFLSYGGQTLLTMALQCDLAGPVMTIRSASEIILAFVCQILLFYEVPGTYSSIGAVLVVVSVPFFSLNKWVSSLSDECPYKKNLVWMLK